MLGNLLGNRLFSHYAASPSASVLVTTTAQKQWMVVSDCVHHSWRLLSQSTAALADANSGTKSSASPNLNPTGLQANGVLSDGARDTAGENAARPAALGAAALERVQVPTWVLRDLRPPTRPYHLTPVLAQRPTGSPAQYTPWTPTRALQRRKHVAKRMGFLMQVLEREQVERVRAARPLPDFRAGDILEVRMMLPEAERKVTIYRGVCIARYHKGIRSTFKIYNVYPECGGVVQHIPLYMPDLLGIKVVGRIHSSQERLFYLLDRETSENTFQTGVSAAS